MVLVEIRQLIVEQYWSAQRIRNLELYVAGRTIHFVDLVLSVANLCDVVAPRRCLCGICSILEVCCDFVFWYLAILGTRRRSCIAARVVNDYLLYN